MLTKSFLEKKLGPAGSGKGELPGGLGQSLGEDITRPHRFYS